jgi:hypothetical protein
MMTPARVNILLVTLLVAVFTASTNAFAPLRPDVAKMTGISSKSSLGIFGKKEPKEDLSFIETRDLTREEMLDINRQNEEIMNMELSMMTGFSLVLSLPILYLCWVAFFSD